MSGERVAIARLMAWLRHGFATVEQPKSDCCGARLRVGDEGYHHTPWGTVRTIHRNFCGKCEMPHGAPWLGREFSGNWAG